MNRKSKLYILAYFIMAGAFILATYAQSQAAGSVHGGPDQPDTDPAQSSDHQAKSETSVELDIFSGRPNPTWTLSTEQTIALGEILSGLQATDTPGKRFDGLGYRGFIVQLVAPQSLALSPLYAYAGTVQIGDASRKTTYLDPQRQVEKWLLETAKAHISDDLYQELVKEIQ